jgi:hypothetical protein
VPRVKFDPVGDTDFSVVVGDEAFSLREHLGFTDDIDEDVDRHPSWEAFWGITASYCSQESDLFTEIDYKRYMAHCREYARLLVKGRGQQATIEAINDAAVLAYSEHTSDAEREQMARAAFTQHLKEVAGVQSAKKISGSENFEARLVEFHRQMYRYLLQDPPLTREAVVRRRLELRGHAERVKSVSVGSAARGFMLTNRTRLEGPRPFSASTPTEAGRDLYNARQGIKAGNRRQ